MKFRFGLTVMDFPCVKLSQYDATSECQDYRAFLASLLHWSIRFYNPRLYFDEIIHQEE